MYNRAMSKLPPKIEGKIKHDWTFLSNHGHLLIQIAKKPEIKINELAAVVGISERRVQSIVGDLEAAGYLEVTRIGRRNRYQVNTNSKFRHPLESNKSINALLKIFQ
jgi:DNA-binding MarR family transcriptional regulator